MKSPGAPRRYSLARDSAQQRLISQSNCYHPGTMLTMQRPSVGCVKSCSSIGFQKKLAPLLTHEASSNRLLKQKDRNVSAPNFQAECRHERTSAYSVHEYQMDCDAEYAWYRHAGVVSHWRACEKRRRYRLVSETRRRSDSHLSWCRLA